MRTCAKICKVALLVKADGLALRQVVNQLDLVRLVFYKLQSLVSRQFKALKGNFLLADFAHFSLKLLKYLGSENRFAVNIVVEAVVNGRTYGKLCVGIKALYRLRENMRCGVTIFELVFGVFKGVLLFIHCFLSPQK